MVTVDTTRPVLHCHRYCTSLMHKLLGACTREPVQPMLARERGVLRHNNDRQKCRAIDGRHKDERGTRRDPLHHIQSEINTGLAAFPHSAPGFS